MKLTPSAKKMFFTSSTLFGLSLVAVVLQTYYANALESALIEEETAIARYEAETVAMEKIKESVALAEADEARLSEYVVTNESTVDVLNQFEEDARRLGVEIVTDDISLVNDGSLSYVQMRFRISGRAAQVQEMLQVLHVAPFASWLSEVSYLEGETETRAVLVFNVMSNYHD